MSDTTNESGAADDAEKRQFAERLGRFCEANHPHYERRLSKRLPPETAKDVLQTTYEVLLRNPPRLEDIRDFVPYFHGIVRFGVMNWFREERRQRRIREALVLALDDVRFETLPAGACVCMAHEVHAQLVEIGKDDPVAVEAFLLVRVDGLSVVRAAKHLGLSRHQVDRMICRVLLRLESVYQPGEPT